jgi:hypothetical protein
LGITLMEVLISIGVVTVGLFGVLALIPLAGQQMNQGLLEDRKSAVGKNAFQQFKIRGMGNPANWVTGVKDPNNATAGVGVYSPSSAQAFCIDPLFAARYGNSNFVNMRNSKGVDGQWGVAGVDDDGDGTIDNATEAGWPGSDDTLPNPIAQGPDGKWGVAGVDDDGDGTTDNATEAGWPGSDDNVMKRISLRRSAGGSPMSLIQAEEIFVAQDDLVFTAPNDKTLPPLQQWSVDKGPDGEWGVAGTDDDSDGQTDNATEGGWPASDDAVKRQSDGDLSWMATVVPKQGTNSDLYVVSIVVYSKRDFTSEQGPDGAWGIAGTDDDGDGTVDNPIEARWPGSDDGLALVGAFYSNGVGGGDVRLTATAVENLDVRQGDWVMLAGNLPVKGATPISIFKWYRVIAADSEVNVSATPFEREVTLLGGDWNATEMPVPQVLIMKNVIAVYEKTLRLERNSLWMN